MLYRGMDRAALDAAYDNGAAVGPVKRERYFAGRKTRSEAFRARHRGRTDPGVHSRRLLAEQRQGAALVRRRGAPARRLQPRPRGVHAGAGRAVRAAVVWTIDHAKELGG